MLLLTKDSSASPNVYSDGDGSNPITTRLTFDGSGSPSEIIALTEESVFVWLNDHTGSIDNYSNVAVEMLGGDEGLVWELSLDNTNWQTTPIGLGTIDVSVSLQAVVLYVRVRATNDGSLSTANYTAKTFMISGIENPI